MVDKEKTNKYTDRRIKLNAEYYNMNVVTVCQR